ncbi:MAG: exo-alpha-sialidase [Clostridia bacterium]|nr:exo-alpha-sialidase [Clostridia bacterium]
MLLNPTTKEHGIVNRVQGNLFGYQGWPSVARDENGVLYAVASSFRTEHVCPFGKNAMYVSKNNGKTWSPPIIVNDTYLDDRDAGILYMGNGRMLITWFSHPAETYMKEYFVGIKNSAQPIEAAPTIGMLSMYPYLKPQYAHGGSFIRISEDYGYTWSDPIQLPISAPHGPNLCADGTLIYLGKEHYSAALAQPEEAKTIAAYASKDGGYTWERRGSCKKPDDAIWDNFHEPHVIELPDGTLLGAIRAEGQNITPSFTIYTTVSKDQGKTWSEWRNLGVCGSPPHLLRHSSGAIICSFGRRTPPFGERAIVSYDNGETWTEEYNIDDRAKDGDLGYPASVELDDGSIMTVYYQKVYHAEEDRYDGKPSILYTRWRLNDR